GWLPALPACSSSSDGRCSAKASPPPRRTGPTPRSDAQSGASRSFRASHLRRRAGRDGNRGSRSSAHSDGSVEPMPLRNRVTPLSDLIADPARGLLYGNRGCLHDDRGEIRRRFATRRWIGCRLEFKGWHRKALMQPGKFTELFFLDEATALAAGHRPCALCRREDYRRFLEIVGAGGADEIDARLHGERLDGNGRRLHHRPLDELPDGSFVLRRGEPWL